MAKRVRVLGFQKPRSGFPVPAWSYGAETYEDGTDAKEPSWACSHDHQSALEAQECGIGWLDSRFSSQFPEADPASPS